MNWCFELVERQIIIRDYERLSPNALKSLSKDLTKFDLSREGNSIIGSKEQLLDFLAYLSKADYILLV